MGSQRRGAQRAAAADTQPPTKPQTLSIFSGTKRVCGMRSPTQLPLEQEQEELGGARKWGSQSLLLANASLGGGAQSQSLPAPPSSTMKPALKGLGSEEDSSQEGDGVCHCCKGGRRKLEGCQGTYQPPSP